MVHCTVVQWAFPGLQLNWLRCCTVKATSGCMAVVAYMMHLTAVRYGILDIRILSSLLVGPRALDSTTFESRGVATGCASSRCRHLAIPSMYAVWQRDMVCACRSWVIAMPSNHVSSPR